MLAHELRNKPLEESRNIPDGEVFPATMSIRMIVGLKEEEGGARRTRVASASKLSSRAT